MRIVDKLMKRDSRGRRRSRGMWNPDDIRRLQPRILLRILDIDRSAQKGEVMAAINAFETVCKKWSRSHDIVLPVELAQNRLEVIRP